MLDSTLEKLLAGQHLTVEETEQMVDGILSNSSAPAKVAALLTALRIKGETADEILGAARAMRARVTRIEHHQTALIDNCGTGGDGAGTFNISTTAAFVLAGAGLVVAKHGNRGVSSRSGSADVLQALGARIDLTPAQVAQCIDDVGIGFMFAPALHPAMKAVAPVRKELGFRTIFNLLGPLTNPAFATHQVIGVFSSRYTQSVAEVALRLGIKRAFVVHNESGIDELATCGVNRVSTAVDGLVQNTTLDGQTFGLKRCSISDLAGGTPEENAEIVLSVLGGQPGPTQDTVVLNAALGLVAGEKTPDLLEGIDMARTAIENGRALAKLREFITYTNRFGSA